MTSHNPIKGTGQLYVTGQDLGEVEYRLEIREDNGIRQGVGTLWGYGAISAAVRQGHDVSLRLDDGETIRVALDRNQEPAESAHFKVSGHLPGS